MPKGGERGAAVVLGRGTRRWQGDGVAGSEKRGCSAESGAAREGRVCRAGAGLGAEFVARAEEAEVEEEEGGGREGEDEEGEGDVDL